MKLTLEFSEVYINTLGLLLYNPFLDQRNLQHLFPAENRRKQNTPRALQIGSHGLRASSLCFFLFFWFNLHFLFLKQYFILPIRGCFKEQKPNKYLMDCLQSQRHRSPSG